MDNDILDSLREVVVEKPADLIIRQIKQLISSGQLVPGDRLPSERKLSEKFGIGRTYVRDAIKKLEFYGILKTLPQSGTVVAGLEIKAIEGLITDVLKVDSPDFFALAETRLIIEREAARLCAQRHTSQDLARIAAAVQHYEDQLRIKKPNLVEEDFRIHRAIADGSKNPVLKSLLLIITPDLMNTYMQLRVCDSTPSGKAALEHRQLLQQIADRDEQAVVRTMEEHLAGICAFARERSHTTQS